MSRHIPLVWLRLRKLIRNRGRDSLEHSKASIASRSEPLVSFR